VIDRNIQLFKASIKHTTLTHKTQNFGLPLLLFNRILSIVFLSPFDFFDYTPNLVIDTLSFLFLIFEPFFLFRVLTFPNKVPLFFLLSAAAALFLSLF